MGRKGRLSIPAELRQAIKERREGLKNKKRTQEDLCGKLQEQKRKVLKLITGMKILNRRKVKRFMRINGKQRHRRKGEVVLEDGGRDIVDR